MLLFFQEKIEAERNRDICTLFSLTVVLCGSHNLCCISQFKTSGSDTDLHFLFMQCRSQNVLQVFVGKVTQIQMRTWVFF